MLINIFVLIQLGFGQVVDDSSGHEAEKTAHNTLYLTGSAFLGHAQAYLTYERMILNGTNADIWLRGSLGRWGSLWGEGTTYGFTANVLLGQGNGRWSIELGLAHIPGYSKWQDTPSDTAPLGVVAFRYQPEKGGWLFKVGAGYPEFLVVSGGYAF